MSVEQVDSSKLDSSNVVNELSDRKKRENDSIQSEDGEKCPKTADDNEMGIISEILGLLFELTLEMKNIHESMTERMDKLGKKRSQKHCSKPNKIMDSKIKMEEGEVRDHLNTEMNTVKGLTVLLTK